MRASGILMHITSLPSAGGVGNIGRASREFVDFLTEAGQKYWQILPLNPTGFGDSPYQSFSTFAGNPYLIDRGALVAEGLLLPEEDAKTDAPRVDYGWLYHNIPPVLERAYSRFAPTEDYEVFCRENEHWLPDYALFMALKKEFPGMSWLSWPEDIRLRTAEAVVYYREKLQKEIGYHTFVQYVFSQQWQALRAYADEKNICLIGDVPIYVSLDSADVWANPHLFLLNDDRTPKMVAGVPPDAFSEDGQLWGNPIYDWKKMAEDNFAWWRCRLSAAGKWYDTVRLDHFRGFESYWAVLADAETAAGGRWMPGPAMDFVNCINKYLPELSFIAEDLGILTEEVHELRKASGWPGMKVLQFAFDGSDSDYLPEHHIQNAVCYLGTHDNEPAKVFLSSGEAALRAAECFEFENPEENIWEFLRGGMSSVCDLFIAQMQDYLELGKESRMNAPGTTGDQNWTWRAEDGVFTPQLAARIQKLTKEHNR